MIHAWQIEEREYSRHEIRRGRRHAFERIDPSTTALVVVDMVRFFVEENPYCRGIVPTIARLATAMKAAGGTVAWVVPGEQTITPVDEEFYGREVAAAYSRAGADGLWPELPVGADDLVVPKAGPSAFFPGRSTLHEALTARDVDTVIITGTVTNVCCESSARDARTLGYRVVVVADATAAPNDEIQNASLRSIYRSFGDVRSSDDVIGLLH